jgi:tetratricopeptide (TPR) repeat protein
VWRVPLKAASRRSMEDRHPTLEEIERFLDDDLPPEESRALQRHLFTCPRCEERMIGLLPGALLDEELAPGEAAVGDGASEPFVGEVAAPSPEYSDLLRRVVEQARSDLERRGSHLDRERTNAALLWWEIEPLAPEQRRVVVWNSPRFQSWGLFELLLDLARQTVANDPGYGRELLELALALAVHLDPRRYGPGSVEAARARAWAYLANALRLLADFAGSEEAFQNAEVHLAQSWLDPLDEALLLELKSSLRRGQRRFDESAALLEDAIALYREVNEPHFQGRAMINKGLVLLYAGESEAAMASLRNGLFLIEPAEEPRLVLVAQQSLIHCLVDGGRASEAKALIDDVRPLWRQVGRPLDLLRLRWLEGRAESSRGRLEQAEQALLEVRTGLIAERVSYDVALVSLDLAALYARQGRAAEAHRMAAEMLPIFPSRESHREVIAALVGFQRAAETGQLTRSMMDEVSASLEKARVSSSLRFHGLEELRGPHPAVP